VSKSIHSSSLGMRMMPGEKVTAMLTAVVRCAVKFVRASLTQCSVYQKQSFEIFEK
jgi:hypothetical protein